MDNHVNKKIAVVTGGTRGIGKAISWQLAQSGYKVLALYARNNKSAQLLVDEAQTHELEIKCIRGDLTHEQSLKKVIESIRLKTDHIDAIVHSAASGVYRPVQELSSKHFKWTFAINFFAIQQLLSELIPMMLAGGHIVGLTSPGGSRVIPQYAAIGSSKGALESLFRHYAYELAPQGIIVNLVCPGMVMTEAVKAFPDYKNMAQECIKHTPTGKMTTPEDIAELVTFLLTSQVAKQIVGQTLYVDGGEGLLT